MNVAVLGLGIIGSAWAKNLIADGHVVRTWNRTPRQFPCEVTSAREAVDGADVVIIVVADPPAVSSVLDQIESVLHSGQTVVQSSTISAKWTIRFAQRVQATGADYIDAPFTGSKPAAEARKTVYYLGGDAAIIARVRPVLEPLSQTILQVGPIGFASSLKLAMNVNIAGVGLALIESLAIARRAGIDDDTFFDALKANASRSGFSDFKEPKLRERDYSPQFSVKHMLKDLRLASETAGDLPLVGVPTAVELYERGAQAGMAEDDLIGLARLVDPKA
ncbi:MAG: NAD(P)-dependent oxidoreductase [Capsulimonadaceae bacterium]|nr:NAD(P)-dependent oxidoreductase [Capsulimonadaceae bacterium]